MPQPKSVYAQAVNIRLHNHKDADYRALLRAIFDHRIRVNYRSTDYLMLSSFREDRKNPHIIRGTLARFVEIDRDGDWLDMETGEKADEQALEQIQIPERLFPNLSTFFFKFDTKLHLFFFESYGRYGSLAAGPVKKFFEEALADVSILKRFGHSEVTVVADHHEIEELFKFDRLT